MDDIIERLKPDAEQLNAAESRQRLTSILSEPPASRRRGHLVLAAAAAAVICAGTAVAVGTHVLDGTDGAGQRGVATTECQPLLRIDGVVYAAEDYTQDVRATPAGQAELSTCQDNRADPDGSSFPDNPETSPVLALADLAVDRVVGIPLGSGFTVYIAEDLTASQRQQILAKLDMAQEGKA